MNATIITIGDEILIGQIVDTNSVSIARKLNAIGITIKEKLSIGDSRSEIVATLNRALQSSDVLIITGGLGPTKDDITKHTLAEYFGSKLVYNPTEGEHVRQLLERRGIQFTELNRNQAMLPECCTVLQTPMAQPQACGSTTRVRLSYRFLVYPSRWITSWRTR